MLCWVTDGTAQAWGTFVHPRSLGSSGKTLSSHSGLIKKKRKKGEETDKKGWRIRGRKEEEADREGKQNTSSALQGACGKES